MSKSPIRVVGRLDIKPPNLVKGIQLEGLRKLGRPEDFVSRYYQQGIDEVLYIDIVASLYERNGLFDLVRETTKSLFVPLTVGGGLRSISDVEEVLKAGADKVAINTAILKRPEMITEIANRFGSQCMVASIEAKRTGVAGKWEAYYDNGREHSHQDVIEWVQKAQDLGAGEILLTSIDQEGTQRGFDLELIQSVSKVVRVPLIVSGGMGEQHHLENLLSFADCRVDAIALAHVLHYNKLDIPSVKQIIADQGYEVRI